MKNNTTPNPDQIAVLRAELLFWQQQLFFFPSPEAVERVQKALENLKAHEELLGCSREASDGRALLPLGFD